MPERPPEQLVALLERLGLATESDVARVARRVRRLAGDLPQFESVWIDALLQSRVLTPYQAAELHAGRGESLRVGPYLLHERLAQPYYVSAFRALHVDQQHWARLALVEDAKSSGGALRNRLALIGRAKDADSDEKYSSLHSIYDIGAEGSRVFAAEPWVDGRTAAQWMVHHGRFAPEIVLEIARAMLARLIESESGGVCHGDVSTSSLILASDGSVALSFPGLRGVLRPEEGYAHADLLPEAYDSLAPERIAAGTPPNWLSDIYACGCVWWHLLCGRPPLTGGNSLAKLRAAQTSAISDVRLHASGVPSALATAISSCLEREPAKRPASFEQVVAVLGPPTPHGKELLAEFLGRSSQPAIRWSTTVRSIRKSNRTPLWTAAAVCCAAGLVALCWPMWQRSGTLKMAASVTPSRAQALQQQARTPGTRAGYVAGGASAGVRPHPNPPAAEERTRVGRFARGDGTDVGLRPAEEEGVVPVAYREIAKPDDLILPGDASTDATTLSVQAEQCVRGPDDTRPVVLVRGDGWIIDKESVRLKNIDFVWQAADNGGRADAGTPAMIRLRAGRADFSACTFQSDAAARPVAIRWEHPSRDERTATSLPSGRLLLSDCAMRGVAVAIDCSTLGALSMDVSNTLLVESGAFVRLDHGPRADEPVKLSLSQVTVRESGPLLECRVMEPKRPPGEIVIHAVSCAFAPAAETPLVRLVAAELPEAIPAAIQWTGHGTLVTPHTPILVWSGLAGQATVLDEASIAIAGLVRSQVQFAGEASGDAAANRLIRWQAPLQSADTPGIDPQSLPRDVASDPRNIR